MLCMDFLHDSGGPGSCVPRIGVDEHACLLRFFVSRLATQSDRRAHEIMVHCPGHATPFHNSLFVRMRLLLAPVPQRLRGLCQIELEASNPVALLNAQQRSLLGNDLAPQEVKQVFWILVLPGFYRVMMQLSISLLGQYYLGKLTPWTNDGAHYEDDLDFAVDLAELYSACADVFEVLALYHFADLLQNAVE
eukprot:CAMPEP_0172779142 /NCGR_PEP_ID=MMETSP1074-20121228/202272_1 /TAXON_ID=2916 /ORGANISM="Ceratium fusus, Strain PA161109" /LENGTH=191 /DNA_ID=CAMNT_0013616097 /DNA_START=548 /DNA_END=1121 /DNA_ORIENTATION=-